MCCKENVYRKVNWICNKEVGTNWCSEGTFSKVNEVYFGLLRLKNVRIFVSSVT